jgi:hypothetical protein
MRCLILRAKFVRISSVSATLRASVHRINRHEGTKVSTFWAGPVSRNQTALLWVVAGTSRLDCFGADAYAYIIVQDKGLCTEVIHKSRFTQRGKVWYNSTMLREAIVLCWICLPPAVPEVAQHQANFKAPGGKRWLIPHVRPFGKLHRIQGLIERFFAGMAASVSLMTTDTLADGPDSPRGLFMATFEWWLSSRQVRATGLDRARRITQDATWHGKNADVFAKHTGRGWIKMACRGGWPTGGVGACRTDAIS